MGVVIGLAVAVLYLLPIGIALARKSHRLVTVVLVDVLLGWTFLGWLTALAFALERPASGASGPRPPAPPRPEVGPVVDWARTFLRQASREGVLDRATLGRLELRLDLTLQQAATVEAHVRSTATGGETAAAPAYAASATTVATEVAAAR